MNADLLFRVIQALVFVAFILHRAYYTRKIPPADEETVEALPGNEAGRVAGWLALPALIALRICLPRPAWMAWSSFSLASWARWAGVLVAVSGFALLEWSHRSLGRN